MCLRARARRMCGGQACGGRRALTFRWAASLAVVATLLAGCYRSGDGEVLVFAAASMADVLEEIAERFEADTGKKVAVSYGGSQALAQQIASGAPADVFVAAGRPPVDFLRARGAVDVMENAVVRNELVVAVRTDDVGLQTMSDLAGPRINRVAMADPELAPAGSYGREALRRLGLWEGLQSRLVFGADVRATMAYLESGNVDAALVYASDARAAPGIRALDIVPPDSYTAIAYPAVVLAGSGNRDAAIAFLQFLRSPAAGEILERHGFRPAE